MPNRAALLDAQGLVVAANQAWLSSAACDPPDAPPRQPIGSHYVAELGPLLPLRPVADQVGAFLAGVLEVLGGQRARFDHELVRSGPRGRCWLAIHVSEIVGASRMVLVTEEDVTERRRAKEALLASEHQLRTIITGAPIILFSVDPDGILSLFDGLGAAGLGVGAGRVVGRSVFEVFAHVPQMLSSVRRAMVGETTVTTALIGRMSYELRCSPAVSADDRIEGVVGIATDVTERARIERLKNEFVSIVSHELRTPLTSIRGSLGLLDGGVAGKLDPRVESLVGIALGNTQRLIRLVNDILDLDKIETGKLELRSEDLEPMRLAEDALAEISGYADECGVVLVREFEPACRICGDRDRLLQVLINLLSNAIKFSKPGDTVTLEIKEISAQTVRFSVCDEGPGISEQQLPKLFRKFSQIDESDTRAAGGSGLGLAISKAIIDAHGGGIGVESQPGVGSRFHFAIGEHTFEQPQRRVRAESKPFRATKRPRPADRDDPILDLIDSAIGLVGSTSDDRTLALEFKRQASVLARRRGLAVPIRAGLIQLSTALHNLAQSRDVSSRRDHRQALANTLRGLERDAESLS